MTENSLTHIQPKDTYWHFLAEDRRLQYGDRRLVQVGETLACQGKIEVGVNGMHASRRAIDALVHAPGSIACLVTLGGDVLHDTDICVSQERTAVWIYDASRLLRAFACDVAEEALLNECRRGREPDPRSCAAIEVARRFIRGDATESERSAAHGKAYRAVHDAELRAANDAINRAVRSAACSAARIAAHSAEWSAACSAARIAAHSAEWSAACSAARITAYIAEWSAAYDTARRAFNGRLTRDLLEAMRRGEGEFAVGTPSVESTPSVEGTP